jgi:Ricin-type beta-trefoil lectin domain-like
MGKAYALQSADDGLVIGFKKPPAPQAPIICWAWVRGPFDPYVWSFEEPAGEQGYGSLMNPQTGLVITIEPPVVSGASLQLTERRGGDTQLWTFDAVADERESYYIVSATGLVMGVPTRAAEGSPVRAVERKRERGQWWTVRTAAGDPAQPPIRTAGGHAPGESPMT